MKSAQPFPRCKYTKINDSRCWMKFYFEIKFHPTSSNTTFHPTLIFDLTQTYPTFHPTLIFDLTQTYPTFHPTLIFDLTQTYPTFHPTLIFDLTQTYPTFHPTLIFAMLNEILDKFAPCFNLLLQGNLHDQVNRWQVLIVSREWISEFAISYGAFLSNLIVHDYVPSIVKRLRYQIVFLF